VLTSATDGNLKTKPGTGQTRWPSGFLQAARGGCRAAGELRWAAAAAAAGDLAGNLRAASRGQGALGRDTSYSKQNIVLYETIKKVPEGSPKYILYFTLNPCFDLTL